MLIPGILIAILTFPGVIVHEFAHKLFCELTGVKVRSVCYFRFKNPIGYVIHDPPKKFKQTFFISVGPFLVNTIAAILIFSFIRGLFMVGAPDDNILIYVLFWLAISIAMHAFPSTEDAKSLWHESKRHMKDDILAVVGLPFAVVIWIASALQIIWFDFIYAMILMVLVLGTSFGGDAGIVENNYDVAEYDGPGNEVLDRSPREVIQDSQDLIERLEARQAAQAGAEASAIAEGS